MSEHNIDALSGLARRYVWLLSELHGGNQFSQEQLWRWLEEAEATIRKTEPPTEPSAI